MENLVFSGVILFAILIGFLAQIQLPKTERIKTKLFQLNVFLAALSYFGVLIVLPFIYYLFKRDAFVLFHLKQGAVTFSLMILSLLFANVSKALSPIGFAIFIASWPVAIFAMIQASRGYYWQLPFVGKLIQ